MAAIDILTISYYDDYNFPGYGSTYYPSVTNSPMTKGLLTATKTMVLGIGTYLLTVMYYDSDGRQVETIADNHLGGTDRTVNTYNFAGELTASTRTHVANSATTVIAKAYTYDHVGRRVSTWQNINGQGEVVLNWLEYNGIGQLKKNTCTARTAGPRSCTT